MSLTDHFLDQAIKRGQSYVREQWEEVQKARHQRDVYLRALERIAKTRGCQCWREAEAAIENGMNPPKDSA